MVHLREIEEAAEEVLSDKQEIVDLDRKRCQNREAIRAMSHLNHAGAATTTTSSSSSQWLAMGNCFFKLPQDKAKTLLQKGKVYKKMTIFAAEKTNVSQNNYGLKKLIGSHDFGKCPYFFMKSFDMPFHIS